MNMIMGIGCVLATVFGIMFSVYLTLSFICWMGDTFESKSWRFWK